MISRRQLFPPILMGFIKIALVAANSKSREQQIQLCDRVWERKSARDFPDGYESRIKQALFL